MHGLPFIKNLGIISIGSGFRCNSGNNYNPIGGDTICRLVVYKRGSLNIANDVGISNSTIVCMNSIIIEDKVLVGGSCRIWDTDFHSQDAQIRTSGKDNDVKTAPIIIRKNAFIGGGSTILKGVEIGENSIVAAGSIVSKNIPPNEIWGGNPAKLIRPIPIK
ncbi:MAG: acyltransferase [Candidatus Cloacimonas sp.]|jgi:acetyltransferase-like isoleucine patch superfamily enzyme|nr:acyltransferase [Candidatus Cloacimonas sp.]